MQGGVISSSVIEGIWPDSCLIVVEESNRSYIIVKGVDDNIVVELDDDGWAQLSMISAAQKSKRSLSEVNGVAVGTMMAAAIRDEMEQGEWITSEIASMIGIDRASMEEVLESKALLPESMNNRVVDALGFTAWSVAEMQKSDRALHPDIPDIAPSYVSRVWKNKRK